MEKLKFHICQVKNLENKIGILDYLDTQCFFYPKYDKSRKDTIWWIIYHKQNPIGFCGLLIENNIGTLCRSGIISKYCGLRLQRKMIRIREKYCRKIGLSEIRTYTELTNYSSINNLIHCHYKMYRPKIRWGDLPRRKSLYFRKDL